MPLRHALALVSLFALPAAAALAQSAPELALIGRYETGLFDESAAEIAAYDQATERVFFVNALDNAVVALDVSDPTLPTEAFTISLAAFGNEANSVAVKNGLVAVAVEADPKTDPGRVAFFTTGGTPLGSVTVGALPDGIAFTPDGRTLVVANEGEPNDAYAVDPEGSVSLVDVRSRRVVTLGFADFNAGGPRADELPEGVRIYGPGASVAEDLEPEFVAVSPDGETAFVTLQENNAVAVVDIASRRIAEIFALGTKDHAAPENPLDASNRDGGINIQNWPVMGFYQPDGADTFTAGGQTFLVTANEGDARDYDAFSEEVRVGDLVLDPAAFPNAATLQEEENLGRLRVTSANGDLDDDGRYEALFSYGARSFSIWTPDGALVYDSADDFEQITAALLPDEFNSDNDENGSFDSRSDDKGPEPEGVVTGTVGGRVYAFVGLERIGGVMVYDVTDPLAPTFVDYTNTRDFSGDAALGTAGDLGPEGLVFIPAAESPNGTDLLVVSYEVSGTVSLYEFAAPPAITVAAVPDAPPVAIPARGGSFSFAVTLENNTAEAQTVEAWTAVTFPDGSTLFPVGGPVTETLEPGQTETRTVTQRVPGLVPGGTYTYAVLVGDFPDGVLDAARFSFEKAGGPARAVAALAEWATAGLGTPAGDVAADVAARAAAGALVVESFPNPLRDSATVRYSVPEAGSVRVAIYDLLGREVVVLAEGFATAGAHAAALDGAALGAGTYLVRVEAGGAVVTKRVAVVR